MTYLGRIQIGHHLNFFLQTVDGSGNPAMPDTNPFLKIFSPANAIVLAAKVPVVDRRIDLGLFRACIFLGFPLEFTEGQHSWTFSYVVGGTAKTETGTFEIIPGGHEDGCILSMYYLHKPEKDSLVMQVESGKVIRKSNPRIV